MAKMRESERSGGVALPSDGGNANGNRDVATAVIEIPLVSLPVEGNIQRGFHFTLNAVQARKLKRLRLSLHESGVTYFDGRIQRHVDRAHDVFGWLLDQIEVA